MSKIKQHLEEQIVIAHSEEDITGWKRLITFNYEGNEYKVILFWDEFNGYEIFWREPNRTPDWVVEWNEEAHHGYSFGANLDGLTWEEKR